MPDNDRYQNAPHLQPRLAAEAGSHPPRIGQHETSSAIALERHIQDGDLGAVQGFLHEAEHQLGPLRPDPWALLEHLADRAIRQQQEREGAGETPPPPGAPVADITAFTGPVAQGGRGG